VGSIQSIYKDDIFLRMVARLTGEVALVLELAKFAKYLDV
jgi:hypothetical protein